MLSHRLGLTLWPQAVAYKTNVRQGQPPQWQHDILFVFLPEAEEIAALIREQLQTAMEEMDALAALLEGEEGEA